MTIAVDLGRKATKHKQNKISTSKNSLNFYSLPASDNFASSFGPPDQAGQK